MTTAADRIRITRSGGEVRAMFMCPGCERVHGVTVEGDPTKTPVWGYNGSTERPTFTPSIATWGKELTDAELDRVRAGEKIPPRDWRCHSYVTDGRIQFLSDCTHALAGQTVDLPSAIGWFD